MAYIVRTRKGYYEERESYRDPVTGKPRSRFLRYLGRRSEDLQVRYQQMIETAERKGAEIDAMQREKYGETAGERREREETEAAFSQHRFLEETTGPTPDEPQSAPISSADDALSSSDAPQAIDPDAPVGSDDALGS